MKGPIMKRSLPIKSRLKIGLSVIGIFALVSSSTTAPADQAAAPPSGRFQPSQAINADTIVDFPVDI